MAEKKEKKGLLKRIPKPVYIIGGSLVAVFAITVTTLFVLYTDRNRISKNVVEAKSQEVIKANYIKGFKNIASTGKYNFSIPENDMNSVLKKASKSIKSDLVETIYYGKSTGNHHYFYVDLNLPVITSRATIDTVASVNKDQTINLKIEKVSLGKVGRKNFLKRKGILNEKFLNSFFETANLPIKYKENKESFVVKPLTYIDKFPEPGQWDYPIAKTFFNIAKEHSSETIKVNASTLGFEVDFSKFRSSSSLSLVDTDSYVPNFHTNLEEACYWTPVETEPKVLYQITKDNMDLALTNSIYTLVEEEYNIPGQTVRNYLASITTDYLTGTEHDYMYVHLIYSINGYLVDAVIPMEFVNLGSYPYLASFEIQFECDFGSYHYDLENEDDENQFIEFFVDHLVLSLDGNMDDNMATVFEYDDLNYSLTLSYTYTGEKEEVINSVQTIELGDNSINFMIRKA